MRMRNSKRLYKHKILLALAASKANTREAANVCVRKQYVRIHSSRSIKHTRICRTAQRASQRVRQTHLNAARGGHNRYESIKITFLRAYNTTKPTACFPLSLCGINHRLSCFRRDVIRSLKILSLICSIPCASQRRYAIIRSAALHVHSKVLRVIGLIQ